MIANLENIQKIYNSIPTTYVVDGVRYDNYSQHDEHYEHGWREVVIPTITDLQRLSDDYILVDEIITKEVIDFTLEEKTAHILNMAIGIDSEYKHKITALLRIPIEKAMCGEYDIIPTDILTQRDALREECNAKILALGVTDFSYRKKLTINK